MKSHLFIVALMFLLLACRVNHHPVIHKKYNQYKDSLKHGVWVEMNDSLQMIEICGYKKGIRHGDYYLLYADGSVAEKGRYKNGKEQGWWISYGSTSGARKFRKGEVTSIIHYNPRF